MRSLALLAALALGAPAAIAQPATAPAFADVQVRLGPTLAAKAPNYGPRELDGLRDDLQRAVARRAGRGGFTRVELVLENAFPNRPTPAQLGREPSLSLSSRERGGAKITGTAYGPQGARPIRFAWWSIDLQESRGAGIWTDAQRAFDVLAGDLARGRVPDRFGPGEPSPDVDLRNRTGFGR